MASSTLQLAGRAKVEVLRASLNYFLSGIENTFSIRQATIFKLYFYKFSHTAHSHYLLMLLSQGKVMAMERAALAARGDSKGNGSTADRPLLQQL